jgi:phosphoesterase RecJ-like protein
VRHKGADPDALGSQLGLKETIKLKFPTKKVYAIGKPSPKFKFMGELDDLETVEELDYENCLLIVLDTPDVKRIDGVNINNYKNIIKIDHHPLIDDYATLELVDENASSVCQLIIEFILTKHLKINEFVAKNLYTGIVSDTGRFMHDYTSVKTFELVTKLLNKTNIDFTSLYAPLYMRSLAELKFQGYIFKNLEVTSNGVGYIKITDDELKKYGVDPSTSGNIISELKYIDELLIWVFLTEDKKNNLIKVNIRSRGPVINEVAAKYGGGGHKYASGARLTTWQQADDLIEDLDELIKYSNKK